MIRQPEGMPTDIECLAALHSPERSRITWPLRGLAKSRQRRNEGVWMPQARVASGSIARQVP
jgi:hypothetical protein